jgi:acetyl esterase/lipase
VAEKATEAGVEVNLEIWDDAFHVWQSFAHILPEARDAIAGIATHIDKHIPVGEP